VSSVRTRVVLTIALVGAGALTPAATRAVAASSPPIPYGTMWTVDTANDTLRAFSVGASGASVPLAVVSGASTGLDAPSDVAVDQAGHVFATNSGNDSITEYAATADGDATPALMIQGPQTGLDGPSSITIDEFHYGIHALPGNRDFEYLVVSNADGNSIEAFDATNGGDALPAHSIQGPKTDLDHPMAIALSRFGEPMVVNNPETGKPTITSYESFGNHKPIFELAPRAPHRLKDPTGLAVIDDLRFLVTDAGRDSVTEFSYFPGLPRSTDLLPNRVVHGADTGIVDPSDLSLTADGRIAVTNASDGSVRTFASDARGDERPLSILSSPAGTAGSAVYGVPPKHPTDLRVRLRGHHARLRWTAPTATGGGLEGYYADVLPRSWFGSGTHPVKHANRFAPIVTTTADHLKIGHLTPGHTYVAISEAVNAFGYSASAPPVTFKVPKRQVR